MGERVRVGHLAFGAAFVAIGVAWLLRGAGVDVDAGWLAVVAAGALGLAGIVTVAAFIARRGD